jgi:hypothetical protein
MRSSIGLILFAVVPAICPISTWRGSQIKRAFRFFGGYALSRVLLMRLRLFSLWQGGIWRAKTGRQKKGGRGYTDSVLDFAE